MGQFNDSVIDGFEAMTRDAVRVQKETLARILQENAEAEYLENLGLAGRTDPESFKACVPLVTHKDLEPYIQRIVDGDPRPVLTTKPIPQISLSSGTTQGKPKFVPFNDDLLYATMEIYKTSCAYRNREFPLARGKGLQFIYVSKKSTTKGGLIASTATTHVFCSNDFKKHISSNCCCPEEVIFGSDFHQSLYCHLLCGLLFSDEVEFVFSKFAHSIVNAFRTFEQIWEELCSDIREGVLSSTITVPSMRAAVSKLLYPNPELADRIERKCRGLSNWYCVIPELFPNAKYVYGIMTGSMEPYLKKLRHYAGDLPLVSAYYGASEGWVAANVNPRSPPESATFAVLPHIGYFEFIPLGVDSNDSVVETDAATAQYIEKEPVGIGELKVGQEYEILITNFAGLYRYRLGDVVRVAGFHNATPELQFVCRRSLLLTINIDKNTEKDLQIAVEEAGKLLSEEKMEVVDFTSYVDRSTDPGHYVIFWETNGKTTTEVLTSCCTCMDLSFVDAGYTSSRKVNGIGPLELRVVRKGTFQKVMEYYVGNGAAVSQFKTPRCVGPANAKLLQILSDSVEETYLSNAYV